MSQKGDYIPNPQKLWTVLFPLFVSLSLKYCQLLQQPLDPHAFQTTMSLDLLWDLPLNFHEGLSLFLT